MLFDLQNSLIVLKIIDIQRLVKKRQCDITLFLHLSLVPIFHYKVLSAYLFLRSISKLQCYKINIKELSSRDKNHLILIFFIKVSNNPIQQYLILSIIIIKMLMLEQITNWPIDTPTTQEDYFFERQLVKEKGWCSNFTHQVVKEYKRFLYLCQVSDFPCVPSRAVDEAWHLHILRTTNYSKMCKEIFGKFLHHAPTGSKEDQKLLEEQFERTLQAYQKTFGEAAPANAWAEKGNGICCSEI